ncbi:hypothetical protein ACLOJK_006702, partial [Asimina triloba]
MGCVAKQGWCDSCPCLTTVTSARRREFEVGQFWRRGRYSMTPHEKALHPSNAGDRIEEKDRSPSRRPSTPQKSSSHMMLPKKTPP